MESDINKQINCGMCGAPIVGSDLIYDTQSGNIYCRKCAPYVRTCYNCLDGNVCDFQTNPSPLPKQVQMRQQMGNTVVSQVVTNPERVKITCQNGCHCYSEELGCVKEFCMQNRFCPTEEWRDKNA